MSERKNKEAEEDRFTFNIMGDEYVIKGNDSPEYKKKIVFYLETVIENTIQSNGKLNKCQIAVLTALKIADELHKLRQEYQYLSDLLKEAK